MDNTSDENTRQTRSIKPGEEAPFFWMSRHAMTAIRENVQSGDVPTSLVVYAALAEMASEVGIPEFDATRMEIAALCGVSTKTVQRRTDDLVTAGVLECTTPPGPKARLHYRLISIGHRVQSIGHLRKRPSCPNRIYKEKERTSKNGEEAGIADTESNRSDTESDRPHKRTGNLLSDAQLVGLNKDRERFDSRLNAIRDKYDSHMDWSQEDRAESKRLRSEIAEIDKALDANRKATVEGIL